jgi:hypothetical protein
MSSEPNNEVGKKFWQQNWTDEIAAVGLIVVSVICVIVTEGELKDVALVAVGALARTVAGKSKVDK